MFPSVAFLYSLSILTIQMTYFISFSDDDKYNGTYRICVQKIFKSMCLDINRSSILFHLSGEGEGGGGDVSYLSSTYILVYADNKGSKETARLCL